MKNCGLFVQKLPRTKNCLSGYHFIGPHVGRDCFVIYFIFYFLFNAKVKILGKYLGDRLTKLLWPLAKAQPALALEQIWNILCCSNEHKKCQPKWMHGVTDISQSHTTFTPHSVG